MKIQFWLIIILMSNLSYAWAQSQKKTFPVDIEILDLKGQKIKTSEFFKNGNPVVVDFWATWCRPCIIKYNTIKEVYQQWQKETKVKWIIVSIDDPSKIKTIKNLIKKYDWPFEIYIDPEKHLYGYLEGENENSVPRSFFFHSDGNLAYRKTGVTITKEGTEPEGALMNCMEIMER